VPHYAYDLNFQKHIIASFLSDPKWAKDNLDTLNPDFFGNDILKGISECMRDFLGEHDEPPSKEALLHEIKEYVAPGRKKTEYQEEIEEVFELVGVNTEYYQKKATEFSKIQLYSGAIQESLGLIQRGDVDEVEKVLRDVKKKGESFDSRSLYDFFDNLRDNSLS